MAKEIILQSVQPKGATVFLDPFRVEFVYLVLDSGGVEMAVSPLCPSPLDMTADVTPAQKATIVAFLNSLATKAAQKIGI